jgi:hypothetical protein
MRRGRAELELSRDEDELGGKESAGAKGDKYPDYSVMSPEGASGG